MTSLLLALGASLAAPPTDQAELARAEIDANAMIAACQDGDCPFGAAQLAESFLVRATAAAVLRGEIDTTSAANARFLAPELAASWGPLLPGAHRDEPEPWVRDWLVGVITPTPPPLVIGRTTPPAARQARPPREPREPLPPLTLRSDAPGVARLGVSGSGGRGWTDGGLDTDVRVQLARPVALVAGAGLGAHQNTFPPEALAALGTDVDRLAARDAWVRIGVGPRWTDPDGREAMVYLAVIGELSAMTWTTWSALSEDGIELLPATRGLGGTVGALIVQPLPGPLALHLEPGLEHRRRTVLRSHLSPRRDTDAFTADLLEDAAWRDAAAADLLRVRTSLDLAWQPGDSAVSIAGGFDLALERLGGPALDEVPARRAELVVSPRLNAALAF